MLYFYRPALDEIGLWGPSICETFLDLGKITAVWFMVDLQICLQLHGCRYQHVAWPAVLSTVKKSLLVNAATAI